MSAPRPLTLLPLLPFPEVRPGDDLAGLILVAAAAGGVNLEAGDIVVVSQKVVSKSEARMRLLADVCVTDRAREIAAATCKDPRLVALVLEESREVLRTAPDVLIVETLTGQIVANAGIDRSNTGHAPRRPGADDGAAVLLLPADPDASAARIRNGIAAATGVRPGVIVCDSFGRPWRLGTAGTAIGVAGPPMVEDLRGRPDRDGRRLKISEVGLADGVASAAVLVMGEGDEGRPVVLVRGLDWTESSQAAADGLRPRNRDLFR